MYSTLLPADMHAAPFYNQATQPGMMNPASTTTDSVFSSNDRDYADKIKEMEEYYMKTILSDDSDDLAAATAHGSDGMGRSHSHSALSDASSGSSTPVSPAQVAKLNSFYNPAVAASSNYSALYGNYRAQTFAQAPLQHSVASHEVQINNAFNPAVPSLPLTSENLQKLSQPPGLVAAAVPATNQQIAQQQLDMLQLQAQMQAQTAAPAQYVDTSATTHHRKVKEAEQQINKQLYKTELCESFTTKGHCKYGNKCQFAHGLDELKIKERRNNFRTKPCVNWAKLGYCPYGKRCCFKHGNDRDIQIYVNAGAIKKGEESAQQAAPVSPPKPRNLHPNVKVLQRISW